MYCVYVIQSEKFGKRYTGLTGNLEKRIYEHNSGKTKSIKPFIPYKLIYSETVPDLFQVRKREKYLKSAAGRNFIKKILEKNRVSDYGSEACLPV
jgi:putative endonuclease